MIEIASIVVSILETLASLLEKTICFSFLVHLTWLILSQLGGLNVGLSHVKFYFMYFKYFKPNRMNSTLTRLLLLHC